MVTGNGRADKAQVTTMITKILALQQKPTPPMRLTRWPWPSVARWRAPMIARMAEAEAKAAISAPTPHG